MVAGGESGGAERDLFLPYRRAMERLGALPNPMNVGQADSGMDGLWGNMRRLKIMPLSH